MILNSPYITGSVTITGNANIQGTIAGAGVNSLVSTASYNADSSSVSSRVTTIENSYATTGSNTLVGTQNITNTTQPTNFDSTAALYTAGGLRVKGNIYASSSLYLKGDLTVYGTQSINYITSSQLDISDNIINVNTATPGVRFGGIAVYDSGSTGLTGSFLWDSQNNKWIYSNPSGSSYDGGMAIFGPRNSSGLGNEQGTGFNYVMKGQGGDHITSSQIIDDGTTVSIPGSFQVTGSAVFASSTLAQNIYVPVGGGEVMATGSANGLFIGGTGLNYTTFKTNGTTALTLASNQAATFTSTVTATNGIFSENSGNVILQALKTGATNATTAIIRQTGAGGNGNQDIGLIVDIQGANDQDRIANFRYYDGSSYNSRMVIQRGGNVGIGTSNPSVKLQIDGSLTLKSSTNQTIQLWNSGSVAANIGGNLEFRGTYRNADNDSVVYSKIFGGKENSSDGNFAGYMSFSTYEYPNSLAERIRISSGGNLGINTTSPYAKLDVRGAIAMGNADTYPKNVRFVKQGSTSITFTASVGTIGAWRPGHALIKVSGGQNGLQEYWAAWFLVRIIAYVGSGAAMAVVDSGGDTGAVSFSGSGNTSSPQTMTFTLTDGGGTTDTMIADIDLTYNEGIVSIS